MEGVARLAAEVLQSGETKRHTTRTPGGTEAEERIWSVVLSPLADSEGSVQALSVAFVETTQQAQSRRRLAVVNDAGSRIGRTLDVAETAQEMADVSTAFADFITVDLLDAVLDGGEVDPDLPVGRPLMFRRVAQQSVQTGCPESVIPLGEAHAHSEDSPAGRALRSGQPYRHGLDAPEVRRWLREFPARAQAAREHGIDSVMGVPLVARGTTLGIAQFFRHRTRPRFDADDLLLAQEIAARASVCVDNARRYARERAAAVALQHSLLPHFTRTHAALDTASRYLPAAERVGGAWFDVIPLSGARVALVVGDVVGHGIPAAATMGRLSTAVRTLADMELPPEELLTHLDDLVVTLTREHARRRRQSPSGDLGSLPVSTRSTIRSRAPAPWPAQAILRRHLSRRTA